MRDMWKLLIIASLGACSAPAEPKHNRAFELPADLYNWPDYDNENGELLHPAGYLSRLDVKPETECDREALRKLVVAINMYSYDMMNQSYYLETNTPGAKILIQAFPSLRDLAIGEGGEVINIDKMSDHLRTLKFDCQV